MRQKRTLRLTEQQRQAASTLIGCTVKALSSTWKKGDARFWYGAEDRISDALVAMCEMVAAGQSIKSLASGALARLRSYDALRLRGQYSRSAKRRPAATFTDLDAKNANNQSSIDNVIDPYADDPAELRDPLEDHPVLQCLQPSERVIIARLLRGDKQLDIAKDLGKTVTRMSQIVKDLKERLKEHHKSSNYEDYAY